MIKLMDTNQKKEPLKALENANICMFKHPYFIDILKGICNIYVSIFTFSIMYSS